jgi:hypothetical protein
MLSLHLLLRSELLGEALAHRKEIWSTESCAGAGQGLQFELKDFLVFPARSHPVPPPCRL